METVASARIHTLYRGYRGKVLRRARQLLRDEQAAEDATQEVFLRLVASGEGVLGHPEPLAWLYRVTTNLCLNRLRDEGRRTKLIARKAPANDPRDTNVEVRVDVAKVLGSIPSDLREIAICYHADGMTCDEIAENLGVSRRTVGNRLVTFQAIASGVMGNA